MYEDLIVHMHFKDNTIIEMVPGLESQELNHSIVVVVALEVA